MAHPHAAVTFPASVERWRNPILRYVPLPAGGIDYWLAWIKKESGGNPCSYTSLRESGLFQLMPPDNTNRGGTSEAALRAACGSGSTVARALTEAEVAEQMLSFQRYLSYITAQARMKLGAAGVPWVDGPSFWSFVKLQHAYPAPSQGWLVTASSRLGRAPTDWKEFRGALPVTSSLMERVLANAEEVGYHASGMQIPIIAAAIVGGAAVLYYLYRRRHR